MKTAFQVLSGLLAVLLFPLLTRAGSKIDSQDAKYAIVIRGDDRISIFHEASVEMATSLSGKGYKVYFIAERGTAIVPPWQTLKEVSAKEVFRANQRWLRTAVADIERDAAASAAAGRKVKIVVAVFAHGLRTTWTEFSHSVQLNEEISYSLDELKPLSDLADERNGRFATTIMDFSCFSGNTRKLVTANTCVVAGAPSESFGIFEIPVMREAKSFAQNFVREMKMENKLWSVYSTARLQDRTAALPTIATRGFEPSASTYAPLIERSLAYAGVFEDPMDNWEERLQQLVRGKGFQSMADDRVWAHVGVRDAFRGMDELLSKASGLPESDPLLEEKALAKFVEVGSVNELWSAPDDPNPRRMTRGHLAVFGPGGEAAARRLERERLRYGFFGQIYFDVSNHQRLARARDILAAIEKIKTDGNVDSLNAYWRLGRAISTMAMVVGSAVVPVERADYQEQLSKSKAGNACTTFEF